MKNQDKKSISVKPGLWALALWLCPFAGAGQIEFAQEAVPCICAGNLGSIELTAQGTAGPFTFSWSGPGGYVSGEQNPGDIFLPGIYIVTVTNAYGCETTLSASVSACPPFEEIEVAPDFDCGPDGGSLTATVPVGQGVAPYTYSWSDGQTTETAAGLPAGEHCVTVADANGCEVSACYTLSILEPLALSSQLSYDCTAGATVDITLGVEGGVAPYEYNWSTGQTTPNLTGLSAGLYTATVTDANGCVATEQVEIPELTQMTVSETVENGCDGQNNGSVVLAVEGGIEPYSFLWSNGSSEEGIYALNGGMFHVTVTDAGGCTFTDTYIVSPRPSPIVDADITDDCGQSGMGSITLIVSGGYSPYVVLWENGWEEPEIHGTAGNYMVVVTDANGCSVIGNYVIGSNPIPQLSAAVTPASCLLENNGAIGLSVTAGAPPFVINWSNGATQADISQLQPAEYGVTVTDSNGCPATGVFSTVPVNPSLPIPYIQRVRVYADAVSGSASSLIYDGSWAPAAGGCIFYVGGMNPIAPGLVTQMQNGSRKFRMVVRTSQAMEFLQCNLPNIGSETGIQINDNVEWEFNLAPEYVQAVAQTGAISQSLVFSGENVYGHDLLDLRAYSADMQNCVELPLYHLNCQWHPSIAGLGDVDDVHRLDWVLWCLDADFLVDESAQILSAQPLGGEGPYGYLWTGPNGFTAESQTINFPEFGEYCVKVTDATGCSVEKCIDVCKELSSVIEQLTTVWAACPNAADGAICVLSSEDYPILVNWGPGIPGNTCREGLVSGVYNVSVYDLRCGNLLNTTVTLPEVPSLSWSLGAVRPSCGPDDNTGHICVVAQGGKPPYQYLWETGATTNCLEGVTSGICYQLTITDACGSTISECFSAPDYQPPAILGANITKACGKGENGAVKLLTEGGLIPFTFQWTGPDDYTATTSSSVLFGIVEGNYYVTVTDACGQTLTGGPYEVLSHSSPITFVFEEPEIAAYCSPDSPGAIDNSVYIADGSALAYSWSTGAETEDIDGLQAGEYWVTVTNIYGCAIVRPFFVPSGAINYVVAEISDACSWPSGSISLSLSGQTLAGVSWSNGQTGATASGLAPGIYSATVTNSFGCIRVETFEVSSYPSPAILLNSFLGSSVHPVNQTDLNTGAIDISAIGGSPPYNFQWSNGYITEDIEGVPAGYYTVTVTDANGCIALFDYWIPVCDALPSTVHVPWGNVTPVGSPGGGAIRPVVTGGGFPYTYSWSGPFGFSSSSLEITGLQDEGLYSLTVTDYCGRTFTYNQTLHSLNWCVENYSNVYMGVQDQCMDINFSPSKYFFERMRPANTLSTSDLLNSQAYITWSEGEEDEDQTVIEEGFSTFIASEFNSWDLKLTEPLKTLHLGTSSNAGIYNFKLVDKFGCVYKDTKSFGIGTDISGFDHRWVKDGKILSDDESIVGAQFEAVTGWMNCTTCRHSSEIVHPQRSNCNNNTENTSRFHYVPTDPANPCLYGGTIYYQSTGGLVEIELNSPPYYFATLVEGPDKCGCLFPGGTIPEILSYHPQTGEMFPVYVEVGCGGQNPPNPFVNSECANAGDELCEVCALVPNNECSYDFVCLDDNFPIEINIPAKCYKTWSDPEPHYASLLEVCASNPCLEIIAIVMEFETLEQMQAYRPAHPYPDCPNCLTDNPPIALSRHSPQGNQAAGSREKGTEAGRITDAKDGPFGRGGFTSRVFPNPFSDIFSVHMKSLEKEKIYLTLADINGRRLRSWTVEVFPGEEQVIPVAIGSELPAGLYRLLVRNEAGDHQAHLLAKMR